MVNFKEEIVYDICIIRRLRFKGIFFIVCFVLKIIGSYKIYYDFYLNKQLMNYFSLVYNK